MSWADQAIEESGTLLGPRGSRMTSERTFPVLNHKRDNVPLASVPWEFIASHEAPAQRNHAQTLKGLAERGGLSAKEMLAVVTGQGGGARDPSCRGDVFVAGKCHRHSPSATLTPGHGRDVTP